MDQVKVLIVGAGPAGATCGLLLRKQGIDCMLTDRAEFPRDKICGGGLTPRSYQLLERLLPGFRYDYNGVSRLKLQVEGREVLDLRMKKEIRIVRRRDFDARLLTEYQQSGGTFVNEALTAIEEHDGQVVVTLKSGRQVVCDYLVGADGANSRVRKYLAPQSSHGQLWMEQYAPKSSANAIVINVSKFYRQGYYYLFPNEDYDVQGFGGCDTTPQSFRGVLDDMGCPNLKAKGAYIPDSIDYPLHDRIILIGDAGGFPNRLSAEGIYYAFLTASHAAEAIGTGRPFREVARQVFANKQKEERAARFFYSCYGLALLKLLCRRFPQVVECCYNKMTNQ
ncbi:MAG: FAD-dependent monooxygenase [Prevotella sp.]|nr:FAD-dependent monooxygenase [Prevotella sp.]